MLLSLNNITKYYGGELIFKDVNETVEKGEKIGIIGRNGCGKTTLLNIICNGESVDEGEATIHGGARVGFLAQNSGLLSDNTIIGEMRLVFAELIAKQKRMEELSKIMESTNEKSEEYKNALNEYSKVSAAFEGMDGYGIDYKIKRMLNGFGFGEKDMETPITNLSGGEKTRLAFCKLLLSEPDLLVLDEPTNHLDVSTLFWLEEYLKDYKGAVLIVSHDRYFLDKVVGRIWEIEQHKLKSYKGNYTKYVALKKEYIKRVEKEYEQQQNVIASYEEYIAKNKARASTAKSARSRENALLNMEIIEKPFVDRKRPKLRFEIDVKSGNDVLFAEELSVGYDGKAVLQGIDLDIKRGEFWAVIGKNGSGKSTLLKCLARENKPVCGKITLGKNVSIGYYDQEHLSLNKGNTAMNEIWNRFPFLKEQQVRDALGSVGISGEDVYKKVGVLSGGERAKVLFAILRLQKTNVLMLDEPTNHLDIVSREVLEDALLDYEGTLIAVSHDRYFINKLFERLIYVDSGKILKYVGGYDEFIAGIEQQKEEVIKEKQPKKPAGGYKTREQKREEAKKKAEISKIEKRLLEIEERISFVESEMERLCSDYEATVALCSELEKLKTEQDELYLLWEECMNTIDD